VSRLFLSSNRLTTLPDSIVDLDPSDLALGDNSLCEVSPALRDWLDLHDDGWDESQYSDVEHEIACAVATEPAK
jgi:hypothetical protein